MEVDLVAMTRMFRNPLPPASGTTIIGIATGVGVVSSAILRHFGFSAEATLIVSGTEAAIWLVCHPQVNRSVPVREAPPNQALPEAQDASGAPKPIQMILPTGEEYQTASGTSPVSVVEQH